MDPSATAHGRLPAKVVDLELTRPLRELAFAGCPHRWLRLLLRVHGEPLGEICVPLQEGRVAAETLAREVLRCHGSRLISRLLAAALAARTGPEGWRLEELLRAAPRAEPALALPSLSIAVCTRDRPGVLASCLEALMRLEYPRPLEWIVIDNAPSDAATERLVRERFPAVRYVREPRPGLDWARNRAICETRGEILAYTDDDAVADPTWARVLGRSFAENPDAMAVTGLVLPHELETPAQSLFELYGGFSRGFRPQWFRAAPAPGESRPRHHGAGVLGTGANMAFRREIFARVGGFDPALDVGTATDGGGDLEFFFRVVQEGYTLLYEPAALVRHQHRRDRAALTRQIAGWGTGFLAYVARSWRAYPRERLRFARMLGWWHLRWILRRGLQGLCAPGRHSPKLALTELGGALRGAARYRRARRRAEEIALVHGASKPPLRGSGGRASRPRTAIITRSVELDAPLAAISVPCAAAVRVVASWRGRPLASALIPTGGDRLAAPRIYQELAQQLAARLHGRERWQGERAWSCLYGALLGAPAPRPERRLADAISVSIVIATRDRPELLRRCLRSLLEQHTRRRVQFVVVDNHPASGLTARAVREFPGVRLVSEARAGLSYARNAGIAASDGEIVVATDDDVTAPPEWLERLLGPFAREEVAIVTGNVLPEELETEAQSWFERYGGLGRGWQPFEVGADWLASLRGRPVPTWSLGATANAAFRASLFADPRVGLLDEGLGPGTPTGCGEDTYLFYRALRAGHTLVYEPTAYVWHRHRRSMRELRSQLYQYSKGHVAYHLTTWLRDGERGAWPRLLRELPRWQLREYTRWFGSYCPHPLRRWLGGYEAFPLSLLLAELCGSLAGPWALCRSRLRVRWLGRSEPLCPAAGPAAARPRDRRRRAGGVRASG